MNSIIRLVSADFTVSQGSKGLILTTGIKGIALILFWSPNCKNICVPLIQTFQKLPQLFGSVKFCALNINENQPVLAMAQKTIAPIDYVPHIVLYVNSKPFLLFDDEPTIKKLADFVQYTLKLIESKKRYIDKGVNIESDMPRVSTGNAYLDLVCDDNVCYLTSHNANTCVSKSGGCMPYAQAYGTKATLQPVSDYDPRRN